MLNVLLTLFHSYCYYTTTTIGTQVVFGSTLLHGLTSVPFSKIFKKYSKSDIEQDKTLASSSKMIPTSDSFTVVNPTSSGGGVDDFGSRHSSMRSVRRNQQELSSLPKEAGQA